MARGEGRSGESGGTSSSGGGDRGGSSPDRSPNDDHSDVKNENNPAYDADQANRAEQAKGGQTLVSQRIIGCVEDLVEVEAIGDLTLKGFHRPTPAFNVRALKASGTPAHLSNSAKAIK